MEFQLLLLDLKKNPKCIVLFHNITVWYFLGLNKLEMVKHKPIIVVASGVAVVGIEFCLHVHARLTCPCIIHSNLKQDWANKFNQHALGKCHNMPRKAVASNYIIHTDGRWNESQVKAEASWFSTHTFVRVADWDGLFGRVIVESGHIFLF